MIRNLFSKLPRIMQEVPQSETVAQAGAKLDAILEAGAKPSELLPDPTVKQKAGQQSILDVRDNPTDLRMVSYAAFQMLRNWQAKNSKAMPTDLDDPNRDYWLARIWREEPIMAGAVYSMSAKMTALRWIITGRRLPARRAAVLLASAQYMGGNSWTGFQSSSAQDFYTTNRGVFWETPRLQPAIIGTLAGIGHIDALCCTLTGNTATPMQYDSETTGQSLRFKPDQFIHFASMPSSREYNLGMGFCAVDRSLQALNLLMAIHNYDSEKLNNLPPEGIAAISGLTSQEFLDAVTMWQTKRKQDNSLTFPQVLWLIGSQPSVQVGATFTGFSQAPEGFDRDAIVTHYVNTLAMCFGVDAREFWPVSSGALGTSSESEIQHLKAKGKGPGEYITTTEREINNQLGMDTSFRYDTQDIEEDLNSATVAKAWIDAFYPLYTGTPAGKSKASPGGKPNTEMVPNPEEIPLESAAGQAMSQAGPAIPGGMGGPGAGPEQVIDKDQLLRLLADRGVLPEWMMNDERVAVYDNDIHLEKEGHSDDYTEIVWDKGVLKEQRLPAFVVSKSVNLWGDDLLEMASRAKRFHTKHAVTAMDIELASMYKMMVSLKEAVLERDIRGKPIPSGEVSRGTKVTAASLKREIERWRADPVLVKYLPEGDGLDKVLEGLA